eukprot:Pgem_evm2s14165
MQFCKNLMNFIVISTVAILSVSATPTHRVGGSSGSSSGNTASRGPNRWNRRQAARQLMHQLENDIPRVTCPDSAFVPIPSFGGIAPNDNDHQENALAFMGLPHGVSQQVSDESHAPVLLNFVVGDTSGKENDSEDSANKQSAQFLIQNGPPLPSDVLPQHTFFQKKMDVDPTSTVFFSMNEGEVMSEESKIAFEELSVILAAMTKALDSKGTTIYDSKAVEHLISSTGLFIHDGTKHRKFNSEVNTLSVPLNQQMVESILATVLASGFSGPAASAIMKESFKAMGSEMKVGSSAVTDKSEIGLLLIFIQQMAGIPIVKVNHLTAETEQFQSENHSNCHEFKTSSVKIEYSQNQYSYIPSSFVRNVSFEDLYKGKKAISDLADQLWPDMKKE